MMKFRILNYFTCGEYSYFPGEEFSEGDLTARKFSDKEKLRRVWRGDMERFQEAVYFPPPAKVEDE